MSTIIGTLDNQIQQLLDRAQAYGFAESVYSPAVACELEANILDAKLWKKGFHMKTTYSKETKKVQISLLKYP